MNCCDKHRYCNDTWSIYRSRAVKGVSGQTAPLLVDFTWPSPGGSASKKYLQSTGLWPSPRGSASTKYCPSTTGLGGISIHIMPKHCAQHIVQLRGQTYVLTSPYTSALEAKSMDSQDLKCQTSVEQTYWRLGSELWDAKTLSLHKYKIVFPALLMRSSIRKLDT